MKFNEIDPNKLTEIINDIYDEIEKLKEQTSKVDAIASEALDKVNQIE